MIGSTAAFLNDEATIRREDQTATNELGEPITETVTVAEGVACAYQPGSTSSVREDSGERVQKPAEIRFGPGVDVREGDRITIAGVETTFEVRGISEERDTSRDLTVGIVCEVERDG